MFCFKVSIFITIFSVLCDSKPIIDYWLIVDPNAIYANHYYARQLFRFFDLANISESCRSTAQYVQKHQYEEWSVKFIDASGALPAGVLNGNFQFMGNYDECLSINVKPIDRDLNEFNGRYCTIDVPIQAIIDQTDFSSLNLSALHLNPSIGVCLPSACSQQDVMQIMADYSANTNITVTAIHCSDNQQTTIMWYHILILVCFTLLLLVILIGTTVEMRLLYHNRDNTNSGKERLFLSFSAYNNTIQLFNNTGGKQTIQCFNGFRLISLLFIILYHSYTEAQQPSANLLDIFREQKSFLLQLVTNAGLWVEAFFLLSGFLCSYGVLRQCRHTSIKTYKPVRNFVHRYLRLTPSLLGIIAFSIVQETLGSGPLWHRYVEKSYSTCHKNWWTNVLYINNIVGLNQIGQNETECLVFTWYLAVDMQLFLISPLLILFLAHQNKRWQYVGIVLNVCVIISSWIITAVIISEKALTPTVLVTIYDLDYINLVYKQTYCRIGPYCVGILMAHFYLKYKNNIHIKPIINITLWAIAIITNVCITFSTWPWLTGQSYHNVVSAVYGATHRTVWSLTWAYVLFACSTGNGGAINSLLSWRVLTPLSRLTYQAYLFHTVLVAWFVYEARQPIYASQINVVMLFLQYTCLTFIVSYMAYVALEAPIVNIERNFFTVNTSLPINSNREIDNTSDARNVGTAINNNNNDSTGISIEASNNEKRC